MLKKIGFILLAAPIVFCCACAGGQSENVSLEEVSESSSITGSDESSTEVSEETEPEKETENTSDKEKEEPEELPVIGSSEQGTEPVLMTNKLPSAITEIMITATSEEFTPDDSLNMNGVSIESGGSAEVYFPDVSDAGYQEDTGLEYAIAVRYKMKIVTDSAEEYVLTVFPVDDISEFTVLSEDGENGEGYAYIEYISSSTGSDVTTKEAEAANRR